MPSVCYELRHRSDLVVIPVLLYFLSFHIIQMIGFMESASNELEEKESREQVIRRNPIRPGNPLTNDQVLNQEVTQRKLLDSDPDKDSHDDAVDEASGEATMAASKRTPPKKRRRNTSFSNSTSSSSSSCNWGTEDASHHKREATKQRRILRHHVEGNPHAKRHLDKIEKLEQAIDKGDHTGIHRHLGSIKSHLSRRGPKNRRLSNDAHLKREQCKLLMDCVGQMSICKSTSLTHASDLCLLLTTSHSAQTT